MATERDWATGYREQAKADLRAAEALAGTSPSVVAMLLQMAVEKAAKAGLLRSGQTTVDDAERTHAAARRLVMHVAGRPELCRRLGVDPATVRHQVAPLVSELERHQPTFAGKRNPNLEYPWETASAGVQWPDAHLQLALRIRPDTIEWRYLTRFLRDLIDRLDQLFP